MNSEMIYLLLFATAVASGGTVLFFRMNGKSLNLILSFSAAYLLGITFLHLVPEIYAEASPASKDSAAAATGIFILAGFLLQVIIEFFSEGIEHGHIHVHKHSEPSFPFTMMFALSVHSFIEGMPLSGEVTETKQSLAAGIILHNIPIAIALMSMFFQSGIKKTTAFFWLVVFAMMTPLGALAGNFAGDFIKAEYLMALVVGIFLHISTTILFESGDEHRFNLMKLASIFAGIGLAVLFI